MSKRAYTVLPPDREEKVLGIFVTIMLCGHWMLNNMSQYMINLWSDFSKYIR